MSEAHKIARKKYWASMTPEDRTARMRALAIGRQKRMSFQDKRTHALFMVAAKKRKITKIIVVEAPGDLCGNTEKLSDGRKCPGCRACR